MNFENVRIRSNLSTYKEIDPAVDNDTGIEEATRDDVMC
jgi:hypothetical protein